MSETNGFIRLGRGFFEHYLWQEPRRYSRAEAWLDLVQAAAFAPHTRLIQASAITLQRGSLVASVRWLCDRWQWSNTKVCQFLELLRNAQMITTEKQHGITIVTLCNYDEHNPLPAVRKSAKVAPPPVAAPDKARAASEAELVAFCRTLGLPESDGAYLWHSWEGSGWIRSGRPIVDWQACVRACQAGHHLPSQKPARRGRRAPEEPLTLVHHSSAAQY